MAEEAAPEKVNQIYEGRVCLVLGFIGGTASTLLPALVRMLNENQFPSWTYLIALLCFGLIGLVVVVVHKETVRLKAFTLGVSAPALLAGTLAQTTSTNPKTASLFSEISFSAKTVVPISPTPSYVPDQVFVLEFPKSLEGLKIDIVKNDGKFESIVATGTSIQLPCINLKHIIIQAKDFDSMRLEGLKCENLRIQIQEKIWSGFLQGVGVRSNRWRFEKEKKE